MNKLKLTGIMLVFQLVACCQQLEIPVTKKPLNNSAATFRFAIVSDRNGGMRKGVFDQAIKDLTILQPEFVISVGDLINGYTEDPKTWNQEWNEFDSLVNQLDIPFYYVPGNHDLSNKLLTAAWRQRHGRDYYYFVYKNVLFLALNTDDIQNGGISEKQAAYFEKVLAANLNVSWTLVFMHRPLWSYPDEGGFQGIEKALGKRKYSLFSAHNHSYQYQEKNGMEHFVLATTGGGSRMRGAQVGEFDHITWVTMKEDGPKVALLDMAGIYDKQFIPSTDYTDIDILKKGSWLNVQPVINETDSFQSLAINLQFKNDMKRPMNVFGKLPAVNGMSFAPDSVKTIIPSGQAQTINVIATSTSGKLLKVSDINNHPIDVELNAGFERANGSGINLPAAKSLLVDWKHPLNYPAAAITIDGNTNDWQKEHFIEVDNPQYLGEDWDWSGPEDGRFSFATVADKERLYLLINFKDDHIISNTKDIKALQDKFYVQINPDTAAKAGYYQLEFAAGDKAAMPLMNQAAEKLEGLKAAITKNAAGEVLELSVPLKSIHAASSAALRINIGIMDQDQTENTKPSVLWWRPVWDNEASYNGSSIFYRK